LDGDVEFGRLGEPQGFGDVAGLGSDLVAQLFKHIRDHHPDHHLVLDEEYRAARKPCRGHCR
jgi:hypothetical protein